MILHCPFKCKSYIFFAWIIFKCYGSLIDKCISLRIHFLAFSLSVINVVLIKSSIKSFFPSNFFIIIYENKLKFTSFWESFLISSLCPNISDIPFYLIDRKFWIPSTKFLIWSINIDILSISCWINNFKRYSTKISIYCWRRIVWYFKIFGAYFSISRMYFWCHVSFW